MKKMMSKKALSLLVMLSAGLSTSFAAPNAIKDLEAYTAKLEQALILRDQPNIDAYGTAMAQLVLKGEVSEAKAKEQTYFNRPLDKQIEAHKYGSRTTAASQDDIATVYRAIDTLALTSNLGFLEGFLNLEFGKQDGSDHFKAAVARYSATQKLQVKELPEYLATLSKLWNACGEVTPGYDDSTYKNIVWVTNIQQAQSWGSDITIFKKNHGWINSVYLDTTNKAIDAAQLSTLKNIRGDGIKMEVIVEPQLQQPPQPTPAAENKEASKGAATGGPAASQVQTDEQILTEAERFVNDTLFDADSPGKPGDYKASILYYLLDDGVSNKNTTALAILQKFVKTEDGKNAFLKLKKGQIPTSLGLKIGKEHMDDNVSVTVRGKAIKAINSLKVQ